MMRVKRTRVPTEMLRARHLAGTRPEPPSKTSTPASLFFLFSLTVLARVLITRLSAFLRRFLAVAKRSGLESMVVPGGVFHEVAGDVTVFAPEDAALERELAFFARVFDLTVAEVKRDAPLLQEILRQFVAYGDARLGERQADDHARRAALRDSARGRTPSARRRTRSEPSGADADQHLARPARRANARPTAARDARR